MPLCITCFDYERAFGSVQIATKLEAIRKQSAEKVYCRILDDIYKEHQSSGIIQECLNVKSYSDAISPIHFTMCIEEILLRLNCRKRG